MTVLHETLVTHASRGDRSAIDRLLERHLPALRAYVRLRATPMIRAEESCSDVVQSVCREVLEQMERFQYRGEPQFRSWLFKKAMSKIIDRARYLTQAKRDVRRQVPMDACYCLTVADTPSQILVGQETMAKLEQAFDTLSEPQREVFLMSRLVGLTNREIAASLDKTELAVRSLLHRALVRLGRVAFLEGRAEE